MSEFTTPSFPIYMYGSEGTYTIKTMREVCNRLVRWFLSCCLSFFFFFFLYFFFFFGIQKLTGNVTRPLVLTHAPPAASP